MRKRYTLGVDVGGTNVKFGLINHLGKIIARSRLDTKAFARNKHQLIQAIVQAIRTILSEYNVASKQVAGIAFGLPGLIDPSKGVVKFLPNIPGWKNVPLRRLLQKKLKIPIFIENDVNMITLGEWKFGAGKGFENLVCITLGTGVGGGLILNNQLYRGEAFVAGEIGHVPLNETGPRCNCGGWGCLEQEVGNHVVVRKARAVLGQKILQVQEIRPFAQKGDKRALKLWSDFGAHIGNALVGVVNVLNPRLIIIGGGVSNHYRYFHSQIEAVIKKRAMKVQADMVKIKHACLGDDAGILGAHILIHDAIRKHRS